MAKKAVKKSSKSLKVPTPSRSGSRGKSKAPPKKDNSMAWSIVAVSVLVVILAIAVLARLPLNTSNSVSGNVISGAAGENTGTGTVQVNGQQYNVKVTVLDNPIQNPVISWIANFLNLGATWKQVIISIIFIAILFAGLYDILELVSIFQNPWVKGVISAGLAIIGALVGLVNSISIFFISLAATLGTIGIVVEVIISILIFIGLSVGGKWAKDWAKRRKSYEVYTDEKTGAKKVRGVIEGLGDIGEGMRRLGPHS